MDIVSSLKKAACWKNQLPYILKQL